MGAVSLAIDSQVVSLVIDPRGESRAPVKKIRKTENPLPRGSRTPGTRHPASCVLASGTRYLGRSGKSVFGRELRQGAPWGGVHQAGVFLVLPHYQ